MKVKKVGFNGGWKFDLRFAVGPNSILLTLGKWHVRFNRPRRKQHAE